MSIVDINKVKQHYKEEKIKIAYEEAIDIFGEAKFYSDIIFDITSKSLKMFLETVYDSYKEKGILKYYQNDIKIYLNNIINKSKREKKKTITKISLLDSLVCDLYEKRIEESKNKTTIIKRKEYHGRKCN